MQANIAASKSKHVKAEPPPDVEAQTGTGLDKAKNSTEGFGVLSARAGSWQLDSADARSPFPPVAMSVCKHADLLSVGCNVLLLLAIQCPSFIIWLNKALIVQARQLYQWI